MSKRWAAGAWAGPTRVEILKMTEACRPRRVFEVENKKKHHTGAPRGFLKKKGALELETSGFKLKIINI